MVAQPNARVSESDEPFFDDLAELYESFIRVIDSEHSPVRQWLAGQLPGGGRAVDIGCGGGRNCVLLAERYTEVLGVDIADRMLDLARERHARPNIRYERRGVFDLSAERDGPFDAVLSVNSVFHMGAPEKVLKHMRELVATGGRLIILDVVFPNELDLDSRGWQVPYAFETAKMVYFISRQAEAAADAVRLMLHPRWLQMTETNKPLHRAEFVREYTGALPDVKIVSDLNPTLCAAVWQAPDSTDA